MVALRRQASNPIISRGGAQGQNGTDERSGALPVGGSSVQLFVFGWRDGEAWGDDWGTEGTEVAPSLFGSKAEGLLIHTSHCGEKPDCYAAAIPGSFSPCARELEARNSGGDARP